MISPTLLLVVSEVEPAPATGRVSFVQDGTGR